MNLIERGVETYADLKQEEHNELLIILKQRGQTEKSFSTQKKCNDQLIDYQRNQNEAMVTHKHEAAVKIDTLRRELSKRQEEIETIARIKDTELRNLRAQVEREESKVEEESKKAEL